MNYSHLVSVILPVYNAREFVQDSIASILNQSYKNLEVIIIDDASTDNSLAIIRQFSDPRIKVVINSTNQGLAKNLNYGMKLAKGKYIARMDADDIALATRIEAQVAFLEKNPSILGCGTQYKILGSNSSSTLPLTNDEIRFSVLRGLNPFCHPSVVFRSTDLIKYSLRYDDKIKYAQDYELWTRACLVAEMSNIDSVQILYRRHPHQVSETKKDEQIATLVEANQMLLKALGLNISSVEGQWHLEVINKFNRECSIAIEDIFKWILLLRKVNNQQVFINQAYFDDVMAKISANNCINTARTLKNKIKVVAALAKVAEADLVFAAQILKNIYRHTIKQ